jgi:uncharacterized protein (TIGR02217 family)
MAFHEVRFPAGISLGATGGPERRTEIVVVGSGAEERNSRWADSKRSYNAGYGIKSANDLHEVIAFFEERRGRLYGFRWRDHADLKSCAPSATPSPLPLTARTSCRTSTGCPTCSSCSRGGQPLMVPKNPAKSANGRSRAD